jgi:FKBP12-rapamycin complex-associated protein
MCAAAAACVQVLDGPNEDLRRDALDTICALAVALGQDFSIFVPTICKVRRGLSAFLVQ